jgi:branched-chain amino acid transport system ATP-binding protein
MSLLATRGLTACYGDFQALFGIDFELAEGEIAAVIGANGAGKSTFLRGVAGLMATPPGAVEFDGAPVGGLPAYRIARLGIGLVPEGRRLFPSLTVEENLLLGMSTGRRGAWTLDRVYALFPRLSERRAAPATLLSGGEQQMAAIGRALMGNPRVLMCDEISLGLSPAIVKAIYDALPGVVRDGVSLIIVEQDIGTALAVADRVYCFQHGRVALAGRAADLTRGQISSAYFGL